MVLLRSCPNSANFSLVAYLHGTLHLGIVSSSTVITFLVGAVSVSTAPMNFVSDEFIKCSTAIFVFGPFVFLVIVAALRKRHSVIHDSVALQEIGEAVCIDGEENLHTKRKE
nr:unnamed protein product [Digitaria exilis]